MPARRYDPRKVEETWQRAWARARVFEARTRPGKRKWFATVPYPYVNGYQHLGFGIAFFRAEFQSRYRRMAGYNVLHPQAFHCTGLPIVGAARRVGPAAIFPFTTWRCRCSGGPFPIAHPFG